MVWFITDRSWVTEVPSAGEYEQDNREETHSGRARRMMECFCLYTSSLDKQLHEVWLAKLMVTGLGGCFTGTVISNSCRNDKNNRTIKKTDTVSPIHAWGNVQAKYINRVSSNIRTNNKIIRHYCYDPKAKQIWTKSCMCVLCWKWK